MYNRLAICRFRPLSHACLLFVFLWKTWFLLRKNLDFKKKFKITLQKVWFFTKFKFLLVTFCKQNRHKMYDYRRYKKKQHILRSKMYTRISFLLMVLRTIKAFCVPKCTHAQFLFYFTN